jgi:hypothetical protein
LAVGCNRPDETEEVAGETSEALTHAQVGAAKSAGLLPDGGTTVEFLEPAVPAGVTAPMTAAYGVNSAGTIVGSSYSPDVTYLNAWTPVLHPLMKDSTGSHYVQGPWTDGSTTLSGISDDGTVVGYGGPAANEGDALKMAIPFVLHPDGTHDILPGAAFGTSFAQVVSDGTGKPLAVGQYSWPYTASMPETMNHWPFDGDGSDTAYFTPSPMPTVSSDFYQGIDERGQTRALLSMNGSRCLQVPASAAQHIDDPTSEGPGVTMMAWIRPGSTTCATADRIVLMDDLEAMMAVACNADGTAGVTAYFYDPAGPATSPLVGHIPLGTWAHIAVTWDKHTIRTYINGVRAGSVARDGVLHPYYGLPLSIGCNYAQDPAYNFVGDLHDVALIRNPLAQDQISQAANGHANYHFGTNGNWTRYRINDDGQPEVSLLPMPETNGGNYWQGAASGVAPDGTIVGYTYDAIGSAAMLFNPIDGTHDLNRELPPGEITAWRLATANGVNSSHVVVGVGTHNGLGAAYRLDVDNGVISEIPSIEGNRSRGGHCPGLWMSA